MLASTAKSVKTDAVGRKTMRIALISDAWKSSPLPPVQKQEQKALA